MKRKHLSLIAIALTACFTVSSFPLQALSLGTSSEADSVPDSESSDIFVVEEDVTKRGEFEKHFLCSDGTYRAVTYAEPVHHYDSATGAWQDNDVSLALNAASARYEAQSGSFAVSFAKSYAAPAAAVTSDASGSLTADGGITQNAASAETSVLPSAQTVTMTNGTYPISWTTAVKPSLSIAEDTAIQRSALDAPRLLARTPAASILTSAEAEAAAQQSFAGKPISDADVFAAANRVSAAEYANIAQTAGQNAGVSLRYSVSQHKIKEDIVIANRSAVTDFVTTLNIGTLTAAAQDDGSVLLTDEYGNTAYTVGVPYLYDADYNVSYDVAVTVEQTGSVCRITYAPNREWLDDINRVYPVVLDPTVTSSEYYANIVDTYVTQADSNNHSGEGNLVVGIKSGKLNRAYIKITNLPAVPAGVTPTSAQLLIKHGANTTTGRTMTLYRVNSSWNPGSITYGNQPSASTAISSCAFNTSNVRFTFSQSQIQDLYTRAAIGTNYGYMIRYSSESTTNPDYNMLRSMEYPTASEQPAFTVTYAYTLPESLAVGEIYLFKNAGSGKYMDVQNGTDANDTNVIQWGWNGSLAQQFKLEQSSTGNGYILRAQVGGKTRVLDIYKTNGRVENGNNVQIYTNVDPKAQEWLILPVDADNFRIVPRSNPALALTSYGSDSGTASGRTSTSAGNVFVSTYTGADNQLWEIYHTDRTQVENEFDGLISSGKYYINNRYSGGFIKNAANAVSVRETFTDLAMFSNEWIITKTGDNKYTIQPANRNDLFLCGNTSTKTVGLYGSPISYWEYNYASGAGAMLCIKSGSTTYALADSDGTLVLQTRSTQTGTAAYYRQAWRFINAGSYVELSSVTFSDLNIDVGKNVATKISSKYPSNASIAANTDFTYTFGKNADQDIVSINNVTGKITGEKAGTTTIVATHKSTGKTDKFNVSVTLKISNQKLYQLGPNPGENANGDLASDLIVNDKTKPQLYALSLALGDMANCYDSPPPSSTVLPPAGPQVLMESVEDILDICTVSDLTMNEVAHDMWDHFLDGTGTDYRNSLLTQKALNHESPQRLFNGTINVITKYIKENEGLIPYHNTNFQNEMKVVGKPHFDTAEDFLNGLAITIHDTHGYYVELKNYSFDGTNYTGTLKYTIYDHFGFDDDDVSGGEWYQGYTKQFASWYVLQHYTGCNAAYKPFIVYLEKEIQISGSIQ